MNNCLVTKLKAAVNNEALSKLNVLTIKTKSVDSPTEKMQWMNLEASENGSVSIDSPNVGISRTFSGGELLPYPYTIQANTSSGVYFENKNGIIEITGKYNLRKITLGHNATVRIKEIYGIPGTITTFNVNSLEEAEIDATKLVNAFNLSKINIIELPAMSNGALIVNIVNKLSKDKVIEFAAIESVKVSFCSLFENLTLNDLADNVNIKNIFMYPNYIGEGNLSSFAKMTKLESITFSDKIQNTGDIMDFINPWIQAGRTSGKIKVTYLLAQKNVTLNGHPITYPEEVTNPSAYLNWTSDGTVTFTAS